MVPSNKCLQSSAAPHDALFSLRPPPHLVLFRPLRSIRIWALIRFVVPQLFLFWALHACDGGSEPGCLAVGGVCFSVWLFGRWKQVLCIYSGSLTNALRDVEYILNIL